MKLIDLLLDGALVVALATVGTIQAVGLVRAMRPEPSASTAACSIPTFMLHVGK